MPAKRLLIMALLLPGIAHADPVERKVTFRIQPDSAQVLIPNHMGQWDRYPVQSERWVKFPSAAFDLRIEARGWKSQQIPVNVNQFSDSWPVTGVLQLEPDSWWAQVQMWPRWPWLLLITAGGALALRRRKPEASAAPAPANSTSIPWEVAPGSRIHQYKVLERLGEGVSAVVYRVVGNDGELALKLLKPQHFREGSVLPRFRREMKSLCRLRHPNIPYLADFGEHQGMNYLAMELLTSQSLLDTLEQGPMAPAEALPVLRQVTEALAFCHRQGILHRDIKPDNVVWGKDGKVRLTDFGLARPHDASTLTVEGTMLGTPAYMAPELIQGQGTSELSDIYSLGCLAYHMLAGQPPFQGETPLAILMQHLQSEIPPLENAPPALQDWVTRCTRKQPEERFASAGEALAALE